MAGFNAETSLKIGARAGISAEVNTFIGAEFTNPFSNAAAHAAWGCVEREVGGGGCGSGARGSLAYSALKNAGFGGTNESMNRVIRTQSHKGQVLTLNPIPLNDILPP